jgi:hypothetical protein
MTAHFFVRAEVPDPGEREAFDRWKGGAVGSGDWIEQHANRTHRSGVNSRSEIRLTICPSVRERSRPSRGSDHWRSFMA